MGLVFVFSCIHHDHDGGAQCAQYVAAGIGGRGVKGPTPDTGQVTASSNKGGNEILLFKQGEFT